MGTSDTSLPTGLRRTAARDLRSWIVAVLVIGAGLTALAPLAWFVSDGDIAVMALLADPAEQSGISWFLGAVNTLHLHVWSAGAVLYLVAAAAPVPRGSRRRAALVLLGVLTLVLVADDQFMLHETVVPWLLGAPQAATFAVYGLALALLLVRYHRDLFDMPEAVLLAIGIVGLGSSVLIDLVGGDSTARRLLEEAGKFFGAAAWSGFPAALVVRHLRAPVATPTPSERSSVR